MIYTGIGARQTPKHILSLMKDIGMYLGLKGWVLRSGGANGADAAFEEGCDKVDGQKEIFIPWKGFNGNTSSFFNVCAKARYMAEKYHPNWVVLKEGAKKLHGRNIYQALGNDLRTPTDLIICWTPDGCERGMDRTFKTGGTGTAIAIGDDYSIPIINLKKKNFLIRLEEYLE